MCKGWKRVLLLGLVIFLAAAWVVRKGYVCGGAAVNILVAEPINEPPHGIGVYIINLARSPERYAFTLKSVGGLSLPHHRIDAVDGRLLNDDDILIVDQGAHKKFFGGKRLGRGALGCAMSHIKAWETFLTSSYKYALICEDDIAFDPKEMEKVLDCLMRSARLWDICSLTLGARPGMPVVLKKCAEGRELCVFLRTVFSAGAYVLNRHAARKLLEKAFPVKMPIDYYFTRGWEHQLAFTGIRPKMVSQDYGRGASDIDGVGRESQEEPFGITQRLQKVFFSFTSGVCRMAYNLKLYVKYHLFGIYPGGEQ